MANYAEITEISKELMSLTPSSLKLVRAQVAILAAKEEEEKNEKSEEEKQGA